MLTAAPKIKFCGITNPDDAALAAEFDAWALGMILWRRSPRYCEPGMAAEIAQEFRRRHEIVGVFVNATLDEVAQAADVIGLTMLQFHGDEGPRYCDEAGRRTGCKVIKAARVRDRSDIQALTPYHTDFHLLDSYVKGRPGGTGQTFQWDLARAIYRPKNAPPVILSGGLTPENVAEAIRTAEPFAVDVASGVELEPGVKDGDKLIAFAEAVRSTVAPPEDLEPEPAAAEPSEDPRAAQLQARIAELEAAQTQAPAADEAQDAGSPPGEPAMPAEPAP